MIVQNLRCLIKDKETHKNTAKLLLIKNFSEKYRFLLPIPAQEVDALLMLYPTETLDLLPPDAQIDAHLKHQKSIFRPCAVEKTRNRSTTTPLSKLKNS